MYAMYMYVGMNRYKTPVYIIVYNLVRTSFSFFCNITCKVYDYRFRSNITCMDDSLNINPLHDFFLLPQICLIRHISYHLVRVIWPAFTIISHLINLVHPNSIVPVSYVSMSFQNSFKRQYFSKIEKQKTKPNWHLRQRLFKKVISQRFTKICRCLPIAFPYSNNKTLVSSRWNVWSQNH